MFSGPLYREGDLVVDLKDTRPTINSSLSYGRDGRITTVVDGQGVAVVKLLHQRGSVKIDELCESYTLI